MKKHLTTIAILLMLLLSIIYFGKYLFTSKMFGGDNFSDWLSGGYAKRTWVFQEMKKLRIPKWSDAMLCGFSLITSSPSKIYSPVYWLGIIFPTGKWYVINFVIFLFLAGLGIYLILREFKIPKYISLIAGVSYMFAGSLMSTPYAGHRGRLATCAMMTIVFYFLLRALKRKRLIDFVPFSLIAALAFFSGHVQMLYYGYLFITAYFIFYFINSIRDEGVKKSLPLLGYAVLAVVLIACLISISVLPTLSGMEQGARGGERGYQYATSWSMPTLEVFDLIVPTFSGLKSNYWGDNYFKLHTEYFGLLPIILALIGIFFAWKRREVKFFTFGFLGTLLFALGDATPFFRLPYHLIPMINKFRGPAQIFYVTTFTVIILSGFGLNAIIELKDKIKIKRVLLTLLVVTGLALLMVIIVNAGERGVISALQRHVENSLSGEYGGNTVQRKVQMINKNYSNFKSGAAIAFLFIAAFSVLLILLLKRKIKLVHFALIAIPLVLIDTWRVDKKFLETVPPADKYYAEDDVIKFLKQDQSVHRVFAFPRHYPQGSGKLFFLNGIQDVGGQAPNPPARYQEYIGAGGSVMFNPTNLLVYRQLLNLLNTKYIVAMNIPQDLSMYDSHTRNQFKQLDAYFSSYKLAFRGRRHSVYENPQMVPRAFLVPEYKVLLEKEAVLDYMKSSSFQPRREVILEAEPGIGDDYYSSMTIPGEITIANYTPNKIELRASVKKQCFLVVSGNYHPDWKAYMDGERTEIYCADYILCAIYLPQGEHEINLVYQSKALRLGSLLSLLSLLCIVGFVGVWKYTGRKRGK